MFLLGLQGRSSASEWGADYECPWVGLFLTRLHQPPLNNSSGRQLIAISLLARLELWALNCKLEGIGKKEFGFLVTRWKVTCAPYWFFSSRGIFSGRGVVLVWMASYVHGVLATPSTRRSWHRCSLCFLSIAAGLWTYWQLMPTKGNKVMVSVSDWTMNLGATQVGFEFGVIVPHLPPLLPCS